MIYTDGTPTIASQGASAPKASYRDSYLNRPANFTTWDALHEVYAPLSKSEGERATVARILREFA